MCVCPLLSKISLSFCFSLIDKKETLNIFGGSMDGDYMAVRWEEEGELIERLEE